MGRTKGATNKEKVSTTITMPVPDRINLLANIIIDILIEEQKQGKK